MPVKYKIVNRVDPGDTNLPAKFYPLLTKTETVDLDQMVDLITDYSTVNPPDVLAVLESFFRLVPRQLLQGRRVEFGSMGSFYLSASAEGSDTKMDVDESKIRNVKIRFLPSKKMKSKVKDISFERTNSKS